MYTYTIAATSNGIVNTTRLAAEVAQSSIGPAVDRVDTAGNLINIYFTGTLTLEEVTSLGGVVSSHDGMADETDGLACKKPTLVSVVAQTNTSAFSSKTLPTGEKLYRRKHSSGWQTVLANSYTVLTISVPYDKAKINRAEIVGCREGDTVDLKVHDTPTGYFSTVPFYLLNQFGFGVAMPDGIYVDSSDYDADLIKGMEIRITYYNNSDSDKQVAFNATLHEVVQ